MRPNYKHNLYTMNGTDSDTDVFISVPYSGKPFLLLWDNMLSFSFLQIECINLDSLSDKMSLNSIMKRRLCQNISTNHKSCKQEWHTVSHVNVPHIVLYFYLI